MKAAVLQQLGTTPAYSDFPEPVPTGAEQVLLTIKAAALKNLDKIRSAPGHYASYRELPVIVGNDGVGTLEDGTTVYAQGITGMIAEKALISASRYTVVPDGLDTALAAALPNAVLGSALALHTRARIKKGDVVIVNGATGVTGQLAVQVAKQYGASRVIATGRNEPLLNRLKTLGVDDTISLNQSEEAFVGQLKEIFSQTPVDIVIDYLWGQPAEWIIQSLRVEGMNPNPHKAKFITVGDMAGRDIMLNSGTLRSADIEVSGSGLGSYLPHEFLEFSTRILPEMFALAAEGKLKMDIQKAKLEDIETVWRRLANGKRTVIMVN